MESIIRGFEDMFVENRDVITGIEDLNEETNSKGIGCAAVRWCV